MTNFTAFDLEMNQPSGKIIQVGAVIGNIETGEILETLDLLVKPYPWDPINPEIVSLCGITEDMIAERGMALIHAYEILRDTVAKFECSKQPIVWATGDSYWLRKELEETTGIMFSKGFGDNKIPGPPFVFGIGSLDAKVLYQSWRLANGKNMQGGLAKALTKFGLAFQGRKHRADADALNTFIIYRKLLEAFKLYGE